MGDTNIYVFNPDTKEILSSLPEKESKKIQEYMEELKNHAVNCNLYNRIENLSNFCKYQYKSILFNKNIVDYTCFTMALNFMLWDTYENDEEIARVYDYFWKVFDGNVDCNFTKKEDLHYYFKLTD